MAQEYATLREAAERHGQGRIFRWWGELNDAERANLLAQVAEIDFPLVERLIAEHLRGEAPKTDLGELVPAEPIPLPTTEAEREARRHAAATGEAAVRAGQVAVVAVAGGRGSRLGYDAPKGTYPVAPITGKSLFQLHAEKILAASRRYGVAIPWYIMTSEATDRAVRAYFADRQYLGLPAQDVSFFQQAWMPAVGFDGKILLAEKGRIATSPNGHGGTLRALRESGALGDMRRRGIRTISYFQVDNSLIQIIDPVFLGFHVERGADFSSKALQKRDAEEGLGAFCKVPRESATAGLPAVATVGEPTVALCGPLRVVEYSDLPAHYRYAMRPNGSLVFSAGSIAIHAISVEFVERLGAQGIALPFHRARKRIAHVDEQGHRVEPNHPNGIQFESFIFDAIPHARNPVVLMVERCEEFAPIKQAAGEDSPATARQAQVNLFGRWLEEAGVAVPRDARGNVLGAIEISPLYALDAEELRRRLPRGTRLDIHLNLQP
jgi:UDP-N-acetylglucosamine/UDP-N-acetylgalactosamine diphosphorylase